MDRARPLGRRFFATSLILTTLTLTTLALWMNEAAAGQLQSQLDETAPERGAELLESPTESRRIEKLYRESHALLLGVSNYERGWPELPSVPAELRLVENALKKRGFNVTHVVDPTSAGLEQAIERFIKDHGFERHNRLLFFFSGHGYTRRSPGRSPRGYIVPSDAPFPSGENEGVFLAKAISMSQIKTWAETIEAKHVLFVFDSCFAGTVFLSKAPHQGYPPYISDLTDHPVREFITAGQADEVVPSKSVFTPEFAQAISTGQGDMNRDGFILGAELGMYLHQQVVNYKTGQSPQYGKIQDTDLKRGDFVFEVGNWWPPGTSAPPQDRRIFSMQNIPERYRGLYSRILDGKPVEFNDESMLFMSGVASYLIETCKLPKDVQDRLDLAKFVAAGQQLAAVGNQYSHPNLSEMLSDTFDGRASYSAGYITAESVGCTSSVAPHLADGLAEAVRNNTAGQSGGPSLFVETCTPVHTEKSCQCVADLGRAVVPNIHQLRYHRDIIARIIDGNPMVGIQLAFVCGIGNY